MDENTTPNTLPEDLSALTDEQLAEAVETARTEANDLQSLDPAEMTDAQVDRLETLAEFVESVGAQQAEREQAQADRAERAQRAADRLNPSDGGEPTDSETPTEEEPPAEDAPAGDEPAQEGGEDEDSVNVDQIAAAVTAALQAAGIGQTPAPTGPRMRQPANPVPASGGSGDTVLSITAAADVPGVPSGQVLDGFGAVAEAFKARSKGFPKGPQSQRGVRYQHRVASIQRNFEETADGLYVDNPDFNGDVMALLASAADERRLPNGSLIAAGGWCAPSENLYGIVGQSSLDGILDLPTIGVPRGGINFTPGPDFADIYTSAGFAQTEAEAIAGTEKPCTEVDCPDFTEVRLDAVGICVKAPLLTRSAYGELVDFWLAETVVANQHKVNARIIAAMRTGLGTALAPTLTGTPVTWATLTAVELIIEGQRQAYRLSEAQALEVVAPRWLRAAIRGDLANRPGYPQDPSQITNEMIERHFAVRGARVQFVLGYLEIANPTTNVAFPTSAEVMVYPAGTFVKGTQDVIDLDTVYDTADLQTNVYTAAFVEDGVLVAKRQHGGKRITLPVNVNGMVGAAQLDDNWGTAQAENAGAAAA